MRLTVRHHFDFGADRAVVGDDLVRPEAWDALRTQHERRVRARRHARGVGADRRRAPRARGAGAAARRACSRAAGRARSPPTASAAPRSSAGSSASRRERELVVTDYAPATVERLRPIFTEAECVVHDLSADPPLEADLHLFHRIDTEFDNRRWQEVFERFARRADRVRGGRAGRSPRRLRRGRARAAGRAPRGPAGCARAAAIEALWRQTHDAAPVDVGDLPAWELAAEVCHPLAR